MQEVFEGIVKDGFDMIDDAISHTDVVALLKYLKVQRALAENHRFSTSNPDFARYVEIYDYVIDLIESGRFAKGDHARIL